MLYNTLRQYEYIQAVAEEGSLTGAADRLNVSQPSLSVAISRVEQVLGKSIFVRRKGAPIEITPFGYTALHKIGEILHHASNLEKNEPADAPFVLGCFEDLAPWHLVSTLDRLSHQFPQTIFKGREGRFTDLAEELIEGRMDLAISYDIGYSVALKSRLITTVNPVIFCAPDHPLAQYQEVELEKLVEYDIILFSENLSQNFVLNLLKERGLNAKIVDRVNSLEMMRSLAANGNGVGISYSNPPGNVCYDGKPVTTIPVSTSQASADVKLFWSNLRESDALFEQVLEYLAPQHLGRRIST